MREVNRRGPHVYGPGESVLPVPRTDDVARLQAAGAWIVDARPVDAFAREHVPGSVSIALRPQFASWLGWVVPDGEPIVFVLDDDQDRTELVRQARNIGYETILGELDGGIEAWRMTGRAVASIAVTPVERYDGTVVDVRQQNEYAAGHVPGALSAELGGLVDADLPRGALAVMCGHGERAMTGASILARAGRRELTVLTGGPDDWSTAHGPLEAA
jgi:rhodanese-related sulfurtransferase